MSAKLRIGIITAVSAAVLAAAAALVTNKANDRGELTTKGVSDAVDASTLSSASEARVFFAHQSVGANLIDGISSAYAAKDQGPPEIVEITTSEAPELPAAGGVLAHAFIGVNGDPEGKLEAFDTLMRSGMGDQVDVALIKFCYIDINANTDVDELFTKYQQTLSALERDFPEVTFLHVTTPLTTAPGFKGRVKSMLGRGNPIAADNATREQYNTLVRGTYDDTQLYDLAAFESTAPDGSRTSGSYKGAPYYTLYEGYSIDEGHLTPMASQLAGSQLLTFINQATA